jgi:heat shock protein HslJ
MAWENLFTTALGWSSGYSLRHDQLEIQTEQGSTLTFARMGEDQMPAIEGASWKLVAFIEEVEVDGMEGTLPRPAGPLPGAEMSLALEDGLAIGRAGCVSYEAAYTLTGSAFETAALRSNEAACSDGAAERQQEQRYLDLLRKVVTARVFGQQLWLESGEGLALVFVEDVTGAEAGDCSPSSAYPAEEAQRIPPALHEVRPNPAEPGAEVEVFGTGGYLYWDNECGQFWDESARSFSLYFDGEVSGALACYAHRCQGALTLPSGTTPGMHAITADGGAQLELEIIDSTVP